MAARAADVQKRRARSDAGGDDARLRTAVSALHRTTTQGWSEHRRICPDHRDAAEDVPIPGEAFSFGTLELAQALGDFNSLDAAGRRALHVQLPRQDPALMRRLSDALLARMPGPAEADTRPGRTSRE